MALPAQTRRRDLIAKLKSFGFGPPWQGKRDHPFMTRGDQDLKIPNEHDDPIGRGLLKDILKRAEISDEEWNDA